MSYINGILTVASFDSTGHPGEYTITGAIYTNQADNTGAGTSVIDTTFVLYVQASDTNTFLPIPGRAHRYDITAVTIVDTQTINLTVLWGEPGSEVDAPTNGSDCIITSTSSLQKYGFPVDPVVYATLSAGLVSGMSNVDIGDISDNAGVTSVNAKVGLVSIVAGANIDVDSSGSTIVVSSPGTDEGTFS